MAAIATNPAEVVKNRYEIEEVVESYSTVDLFPAEKTIFCKYLKPGSSILDIGCGAGRTSIPLAMKGYRVTAFDFAPKMIEAAQKLLLFHHVDLKFYVKDATRMDYPNESFDNIIFSFNGLEQIPGSQNRLKVLEDAYRFLKPGGYFIFTTRSGLAFGSRRALVWIRILFEFISNRLLKGDKEWELGDTVRNGNYFNYTNPFKIRKIARRLGFFCRYFNSEKNIETEKRASFFTNFSSDRMLFYVLHKPSNELSNE